MTPDQPKGDFSVDLETRQVSHDGGWVFRIVPAMDENDAWEVICVSHPSPITPRIINSAVPIAAAARLAYIRALASLH